MTHNPLVAGSSPARPTVKVSASANARTFSTSLTLPTAPAPGWGLADAPARGGRRVRLCNGCSTASGRRPSSVTDAWISSRATTSDGQRTLRSTTASLPENPRTSPPTHFSTTTPTASTRIGTPPRTRAYQSCAPKPAATPTTSSFHHTVVGNLELAYESVDMISEPRPQPDDLPRRNRLANLHMHSTCLLRGAPPSKAPPPVWLSGRKTPSVQCPGSNSSGTLIGPMMPVMAFQAAGRVLRGLGMRWVITRSPSVSSMRAR